MWNRNNHCSDTVQPNIPNMKNANKVKHPSIVIHQEAKVKQEPRKNLSKFSKLKLKSEENIE